jgi:SAM-dependent methyltransferase
MTSYDEVLYPSHSFAQAHPDRLATQALIFGMRPAPLEHCRVLELGCGDGGHIIPVAYNFPGSEFVGVDLAARPVEKGRRIIADMGLENVRLHHMSVEDFPPDAGVFDYVIAHGLYSWVPTPVRDRVLSICEEHLAPSGVAYVSYNVLPGGHLRRMTREMMLWHARDSTDSAERVARAQGLLETLSGALDTADPFAALLREEVERVRRFLPAHLFHDDLAEINAPIYFHEFVEHAARHNLQYLAEADYSDMATHSLSGETVEALRRLAGDDPLALEQYADFVKCRKFRQTLLCRRGAERARERRPEAVQALYVSSPLSPKSAEPDVRSRAVEEFWGVGAGALTTDSPLVKAAALILGETWPQAVSFDDLLSAARARAGVDGDESTTEEDAQRLSVILLDACEAGVVKLHAHRPNFVTRVSERPRASGLARAQLRHGALVTTQSHANVEIKDALGRSLLLLLDGTRDRAALLAELSARVRSGDISVGDGAAGAPTPQQLLDALPSGLERSLEGLANSALLVA